MKLALHPQTLCYSVHTEDQHEISLASPKHYVTQYYMNADGFQLRHFGTRDFFLFSLILRQKNVESEERQCQFSILICRLDVFCTK